MNYKNVGEIKDYCSSCGGCIPICPKECISYNTDQERIMVDNEKCIKCGICLENCTGLGFDFGKYGRLFNNNHSDFRVGSYSELYVGKSNDPEILMTSTSGGLATSILVYCLEEKIIEGAIIITRDPDNPLREKYLLARNKKDLLKHSRSRYHLIPLVEYLKELKNEKNLAFVGLPCHLQAIRKIQESKLLPGRPITLMIGLYCGMNQSFESTKFILKKLKINPEEVRNLDYRGPKWLGGFNVETADKTINLSKEICDFTNAMFLPRRCQVCYDYTNEFADISLGDAWSKKTSESGESGWNEAIVRSEKGQGIVRGMIKKNKITVETANLDTILNSHPGNFNFKKKGIFLRMKKLGIFPDYNLSPIKLSKKELIFQNLFFNFICLMQTRTAKRIFSLVPFNFAGKTLNFVKAIIIKIFLKKTIGNKNKINLPKDYSKLQK